jgi:hypothetical protein
VVGRHAGRGGECVDRITAAGGFQKLKKSSRRSSPI